MRVQPSARLFVFPLAILLGAGSGLAQGDYRKGLSHFKQGQYQEAIDEFEPLVKEHPTYESGHRILGLSYLRLKQYEKAISELRTALRLKQDAVETYLGLAQAYYNSRRFREVIPTLNQAVPYAKSPRSRNDLLRMRGSAAYNLAQYELAASDLQEASRIQKGSPSELLQLGLARYHLKRLEPAEQALRQVLTSDPNHAEANRFLLMIGYQKGVGMIEEGLYSEAAEAIFAYTERFPEDAQAWFNLGLAYLFADNLEAAKAAFLREVGLKSDSSGESFDRLGYIYEKTKEYQKALEHYQKAAELTGSNEARASVDRIKRRLGQSG